MDETNVLQHHGILGMKWGIRRFQRKDGSLTSAGKKRYGDKDSDKSEETVEEKRAKLLKSTDAKELYKNRNLLTTSEIEERISRLNTEQRLANIASSTEKSGQDIVNDKMKKTTETITNAKNLYKSIDDAYSTVANSAIGKVIAKKLGIEPPKKKFDVNEFWKNRHSKSAQEMMEANKWLTAEEQIRQKMESGKKSKAEKDAQKQVDDYNKEGHKDDKVKSETPEYSKSGDDIIDNKVATGKESNTERLKIEQVDRYEGTVEGKGTSKFTGWNKNDTIIDVDFTSDNSMSDSKTIALATTGRRVIAGLLPDLSSSDSSTTALATTNNRTDSGSNKSSNKNSSNDDINEKLKTTLNDLSSEAKKGSDIANNVDTGEDIINKFLNRGKKDDK